MSWKNWTRFCQAWRLHIVSSGMAVAGAGLPLSDSVAVGQDRAAVELDEEAKAAETRLRELLPADSEAAAMLEAIVEGRSMTRNDGWFTMAKPQSAYAWNQMLQAYDSDGDGKLTRSEFPGAKKWFDGLDRNRDGVLSDEDHRWNVEPPSTSTLRILRRLDIDDNGRITRDEINNFFNTLLPDGQKDGSIDELRLALDPPTRVAGQSIERPTASQLMIGLEKQEIGSHLPGPAVGEIGMDFTLKTVDGQSITLSTWCQEKPVVLIFGNFTCGPFRAEAGNLERLYERYGDEFHFLVVYVREAHPSDGWAMRRNEAAEIVLPQPTKYEERAQVAQQCQQFMGDKIPLVIDEMNDPVGREYSGMPSRLYLLDAQRQVLFKSGRGPHYFVPAELEETLLWHLAETAKDSEQEPDTTEQEPDTTEQDSNATEQELASPYPTSTMDESELQHASATAWENMGIQFPILPRWAVQLSESLPESTIALLELDYRHRQQNPLGNLLAAQIRWIVADAMNCQYAKLATEFDLQQAGWSIEQVAAWQNEVKHGSASEQTLWNFARQLTLAGHSISDEAFAELSSNRQPESVVAIVHTVAFANFQNRLFLGLPCPPADSEFFGAVQPPVQWRSVDARKAPARPEFPTSIATQDSPVLNQVPLTWTTPNFGRITSKLESQKARPLRLPLPDPTSLDFLPVEERQRSEKVIWSRLSLGYQPELTQGWFHLMRTFRRESNLDRVFSNSMFWVVTRTNECFY